jgi:NDP-sugar pyrophosphorylase family protein
VEKPPAGQEPSNTINAGTYVLEPAALAQIENGQRVSIERETFPTLAAAGQLYAHTFDGYWLDAGKVDSYRQANLDMAAAHGGVHHGAVVDPRSRVVDSILGDRVQVAAGAVVIDSILGAGCVIGPGAHIVDSILGPGVVVAALQEISGAVIA